jgi:catechol 2,3-dioxygenase-like lactoylglutathione lyase family enzyme
MPIFQRRTRRMAAWFASIACGLALVSNAAQAQPTPTAGPTTGFAETVIVVRDLDSAVRFYQRHAGWTVIARQHSDPALATVEPLGSKGREVVLGLPGEHQGMVRLVQPDTPAGAPIREGTRPFDTGGFMDVNARVKDLDTAYKELTDADGCVGHSLPLQYGFGAVVVKEALLRCPDGVSWALLQRVSPPAKGLPVFDRWSYATNATVVVSDYAAARRFFVNQLGFAVQSELLQRASTAPGTNILGLPNDVAITRKRDVALFIPKGAAYGSVEILSFGDMATADVSARALETRRGAVAVRFEVADADRYAAELRGRGLEPSAPVVVTLQPYGRVRLFHVVGPQNIGLDFFSRILRPGKAGS